MEETYTIGTVARLADVGIETIRFYERKGLIRKPARNNSGYRIYTADVVQRLRFIRDARDLGFSLAQVQTLLGGHDKNPETCRAIKELLLERKRKIEELQVKIAVARAALERLIDDCPATAECPRCLVAVPIEHDNDGS